MTKEEVLNYTFPVIVDVDGHWHEISREEILEHFEFYKALAELDEALNDTDTRKEMDEFFRNEIDKIDNE